jgi:hypothetical protein
MSDTPQEYQAFEHLLKAEHHAAKAEQLFGDDSRGESVANNTQRWADRSVQIAVTYLENTND